MLDYNKVPITYTAALLLFLLLLPGCAHLGIYRLSLEARPTEGKVPIEVNFIGRITGGPDFSPELYCQTQIWNFGKGEIMSVIGLCPGWKPGTKLERDFHRIHTYNEPGTYEASFSYGPLESETLIVTVLE